VRQPQRDARQGRRVDVPAPAGGLIDIRELTDGDVATVGNAPPLARLGGRGTYLVAWDAGNPVAHAHISWTDTTLGVPEIQDVFVREDRRRHGFGTAVTLARSVRQTPAAIAGSASARASTATARGDSTRSSATAAPASSPSACAGRS
jgi:GNAT superfamily N-acetyltransferase